MHFLIKFYRRGYISAGVIAAALAYLVNMSWLRWGDLVIDLGREMYVPVKLAEGAVLYRDIFYLYGPFSPYFNAFLYKIFGTSILSLVIGGILVTALTSWLLYKIARMFLNVFFATFTVLVFLFVLAFGHYVAIGNYNFILPYSYPATHAILFSLGAMYFLFRSFDRQTARDAYFAGACVFLSLITRAEIGAMLAVSVLTGVIIMKCTGARGRLLRPLVLFPLAAALAVYAGFFLAAGPRVLESNLIDLFKSNTQASPFAVLISGAHAAGQNTFLMLKSAFFYLLFAVWFGLAGYVAGLAARLKGTVARHSVWGVVAAGAGLGALVFLKIIYDFELQYRSLPAVYLLVGALSLAAYIRFGRKACDLKLFVLALFSFLVVMRIILQVHAWHYGFYILVPGLVVYQAFFFRILPRLARHKFMTAAFYAGFTLVLVVLMADHFQVSKAWYERRTLPVPSPRGDIRVFPGHQGVGMRDLVDFFIHQTPGNATVAVFPEGVMLNFLAERESPLYYYSFLPQDIARAGVEQSVVDDMGLRKPDYVVVVQRSVAEYGSRGFGVDYGLKILGHIDAHYTLFARRGPLPFAPDNFTALIFKLKR